jgi:ABC-type multidrug transport system ATPase subunit
VTLTVEQNILVFTHLYRIRRSERREAIDRALKMANLVDRRDSRVDKLSGGMRRRLLIARALVHRPRLVLLDEPTVGLDPQVRQELWALIDALRAEGTTILMSTHYIEEAQRLADTVLIMSAMATILCSSSVEIRRVARPKRGRNEANPCSLKSWITLRTCDSSVIHMRAISGALISVAEASRIAARCPSRRASLVSIAASNRCPSTGNSGRTNTDAGRIDTSSGRIRPDSTPSRSFRSNVLRGRTRPFAVRLGLSRGEGE